MNLPISKNLPINKLASVFGSTSASYKFYWLISLIELIEEGHVEIPKKKIFTRMIVNTWYTINYFQVSFGPQDKLQIAVKNILKEENLQKNEKKLNLQNYIENSKSKITIKELLHFDKNVPHWFLSPWYPKRDFETNSQQKSRIYKESQSFSNDVLYALHKDYVAVNSIWLTYLKSNSKVLKDYCYWNLSLFLQTRNPNVPDIPNKIIKPATRNSLTKQTNEFWKLVFKELGSINCIFTGTKLVFNEKNYALDHFIPHAFVSHDLIWNLLPIDKKFNSHKSDKLPLLDKHFDNFFELQKQAYEIVLNQNPKNKFLEDYLTIFPVHNTSIGFEYLRFRENIEPLITIAHNNGFLYME